MSWLSEFEQELIERGIRPAARERLVAEFADHLACEQGSSTRLALTRLGAAREIAGQYADELAADDARQGALGVFAALSLRGDRVHRRAGDARPDRLPGV